MGSPERPRTWMAASPAIYSCPGLMRVTGLTVGNDFSLVAPSSHSALAMAAVLALRGPSPRPVVTVVDHVAADLRPAWVTCGQSGGDAGYAVAGPPGKCSIA